MLTKIVDGIEVDLSLEEEQAILNEWAVNEISIAANLYKDQRRAEYPPLGDQLDAIIKTFKYLKSDSVDLGVQADWLIQKSDEVKAKYLK